VAELPAKSPDKPVAGFFGRRKVRRKRSRPNPRREMSFLEHLDELRGRLIICVVSIVFTTIVGGIFFARPMLNMLTAPFIRAKENEKGETLILRIAKDGTVHAVNLPDWLEGRVSNQRVRIVGPGVVEDKEIWLGSGGQGGLIATTLFAPILLILKAAIILGIVFALPVWLWQIWLFVAPAFTAAERKAVRPVLLSGIVLFPLGVASAYGLWNLIMPILLEYAKVISGVVLMPDIQKFVSAALNLMLAFGIVFETPLILVMIVRMGIVSTGTLKRSRPYVVVIIFILAAVLTPTADPFTMIGMALPMLVLFEISLFVAGRIERKIQAADRKDALAG